MEALEYHHALELFSRHAFKQTHPNVGYEELSSNVMKYARGVHLALKVLGCFLVEREKEVWESAINKLRRILHPSILEHYSKLNQIIHAACNKLIAKTPNPTLMPRLNKLAILNLRGSKSHKSLPYGIFNLEFLTKLDLSGCSKLKRLPEISSGNISWLFLRGTAIEELPSSIEHLLRLGHLDLSDCKRLKSLPSSLLTWKKKVDIGDKLSVRVEKGLLNAEDWKLLLTSERLLSTYLISSLPHYSKKKKTKRTKGNMSTAKRTPAEIAKALIEEMSDEKGEPRNKKPRRASQKNKVDEKKEKQPAVSARNMLPQSKSDRASDSRPLRILPPTPSPICPKGSLLESSDIIESKR
ncbi:hypothetical protein WN943_015681 [Citrus x changshan-huyou]